MITLGELHEVIARAMGWGGGHLHVFSDGIVEYGVPDGELGFEDEDAIELDEVLSEPGDRFTYTYDFGDDWEHDIKLEKVLPPDPGAVVPACLAGKGACPPEDCGGASGFADLKEAIIDPAHDEHAELLDWLGIDDRPTSPQQPSTWTAPTPASAARHSADALSYFAQAPTA